MNLTATQRKAVRQGGDVDSPGDARKASKQYLWPNGVVHFSLEEQLSNVFLLSVFASDNIAGKGVGKLSPVPSLVCIVLSCLENIFCIILWGQFSKIIIPFLQYSLKIW